MHTTTKNQIGMLTCVAVSCARIGKYKLNSVAV